MTRRPRRVAVDLGDVICLVAAGVVIGSTIVPALAFGDWTAFPVAVVMAGILIAVALKPSTPTAVVPWIVDARIPRDRYDALKAAAGDCLIAARFDPPAAVPEAEITLRIDAEDPDAAEARVRAALDVLRVDVYAIRARAPR